MSSSVAMAQEPEHRSEPDRAIPDYAETALPVDLHADYKAVGIEAARIVGGEVISDLVAQSGLGLREIERRHGFDASTLSRQIRGVSKGGVQLSTLFALAAALDLKLDIAVRPSRRSS